MPSLWRARSAADAMLKGPLKVLIAFSDSIASKAPACIGLGSVVYPSFLKGEKHNDVVAE